jgi:putative ABC transport system permease protein
LDAARRVDPSQQRAALVQVLDRLREVPGVQAVSSAEFNVLGRPWTHNFRMPGTQHEWIEATVAPITPGFFETMQIPVLAGRGFAEREMNPANTTAIVVNETFANRYYGRAPAVGGVLETRFDEMDRRGAHEIIGVVSDARYDLRKPPAPTVYIPLRLRNSGTVHVRVAGDPAAIGSRLREEVHAASPLHRVTSVKTQAVIVGQTLVRERLLAVLSGFFALVGLMLAAVGLYGVLSYSVAQRTREIGIRLALGARQLGVIRTVVGDVGGATLVGAACGLAGGLYLSRFVEALLFEVTPMDFWSLALPLGALLLSAVAAAILPALRAARVDPVIALRCE